MQSIVLIIFDTKKLLQSYTKNVYFHLWFLLLFLKTSFNEWNDVLLLNDRSQLQEDEARLLRHMFTFIRAGKLEEVW